MTRYSTFAALLAFGFTPACDGGGSIQRPLKENRGKPSPLGKADGSVPGAWNCSNGYYDSDDGCDCGCGVVDPDCASDELWACEYEWCSGTVDASHNWVCEDESTDDDGWTCPAGYYDSADGCDCGCGIVDPDCDSAKASACDYTYCPSGQVVSTYMPIEAAAVAAGLPPVHTRVASPPSEQVPPGGEAS